MAQRQLTVASRIKPGTVARIGGKYVTVARVTGSPGRSPSHGQRLQRVFVKGRKGYVTVRANDPVEIRSL